MIKVDKEIIQAFEDALDPAEPESAAIGASVVGYGEMSCVLSLAPYPDLVFKRMSGFESAAQMSAYRDVIITYCDVLGENGIDTASTSFVEIESTRNDYTLYLVQPRIASHALGNARLEELEGERFEALVRTTVETLGRLWTRNGERGPGELIGLDAQISNWAYEDVEGSWHLTYFDTGTPFVRRDGEEVLDGEVHLKAMPFFLRWIVRRLFMSDVLDRYYDLQGVLVDFLGNFHKEGHAEKIDAARDVINAYLAGDGAHLNVAPIERAEVDRYYKEDAFIWTIFLAFRRFDRFLTTRVLRRRYNYILPGRIAR